MVPASGMKVFSSFGRAAKTKQNKNQLLLKMGK